MHVCPQTLVLVDNDATVSEVNRKLVKATLKYIFYHAPEDRTFCLDTYEHDICSEEVYTDEINDLVCAADNIEFAAKDSNLCDTLCEVITRWKESDFACRDIIVFTDGLEGSALSHEKEELYYLTENSEYPVYVVMLDQDNNAEARKGLSAIAVTSGGELIGTEFPGSDAGIDKKIYEMISSHMDEYSRVHWKKYEEEAEDELAGETAGEEGSSGETPEETVNVSEINVENTLAEAPAQESVIYEYDKTPGFFESKSVLILSAILIAVAIITAVFGSFVIMKKRRKGYDKAPVVPDIDDKFFEDYELKGIETTDFSETDRSATVLLSDEADEFDRPTRLLADDAPVVSLTDKDDDKRRFNIVLGGRMSIGRGDCDVVITGDDALSKRHCELYEKEGNVYVRDLSSSNGTKVNGKKIEESILCDGDELTVGAHTYCVKTG